MILDAKTVAQLALPEGKAEARFFDEHLSGFGVRLRAGGKRTWIVQARERGVGKQTTFTIGPVAVVDAAKARAAAKDKLAEILLGLDPQGKKDAARAAAAQTMGKLVDLYIDHITRKVRPATLDAVARALRQHWLPLHGTGIGNIGRRDVAAQLAVIRSTRGPVAANRSRSYLSGFFAWAIGEGLAPENPVSGTNKSAEVSRERVLTDDELRLIWTAAPADDYGRIVRLLLLTAQRRDEVGSVDRNEIAAAEALWTIPSARTKNGRQHFVPLSAPALEIISAADADRGEKTKLFGRADTGFSGWSKSKAALDARIAAFNGGQPLDRWTLHDLRRTAGTRMNDLGIAPHVVEAILNHVSTQKSGKAGVSGTYNRALYAAEKRQALDIWAAHVLAVAAGDQSNVVSMARV